jgi:hypothetical protein
MGKMCRRLDPDAFFDRDGIETKIILVVQVDPPRATAFPFGETVLPQRKPRENAKLVALRGSHPEGSLESYIEENYHTCEVGVSAYEKPTEEMFVVAFSEGTTDGEVRRAIGEVAGLGYDPEVNGLNIYGKSLLSDGPGTSPLTGKSLVGWSKIFFRFFPDIPQAVLAEMTELKYRIAGGPIQTRMINKAKTVADVFAELELDPEEMIAADETLSGGLTILKNTTKVLAIGGTCLICTKPGEGDRVIPVSHPRSAAIFVPFFFVLIQGEKFEESKLRLRNAMNISEEEFSKLVFRLERQPGVYYRPMSLTVSDSMELFDRWAADAILMVSPPRKEILSHFESKFTIGN